MTFLITDNHLTEMPFEGGGFLNLAIALLLIGLLLLKELLAYSPAGSQAKLSRALDLAIAPLLLAFLAGVALKVAAALR